MDIRAVDGRVTTGSPATPLAQAISVGSVADENLTGLALDLRVTLETEIRIALDEHFSID